VSILHYEKIKNELFLIFVVSDIESN